MTTFDVLDRNLTVYKDYLLEASAGTGKTFSIENIVVRLLVEGEEPALIDQILVVTFTRASTRDLKTRIRANIEKALKILKENVLNAPDYLRAILEQGDEISKKACRRLEQALFNFDQAQIFTIHSFCSRMLRDNVLEGDIGISSVGEEQLPNTELLSIIRDFFRTKLTPDLFSTAQINIVLKHYKGKIDKLEQELLRYISGTVEVENTNGFSTLFERFKEIMGGLKEKLNLNSADIIADFELQIPHYRKMAEAAENVAVFAQLFDKSNWTREDFDLLIKDRIYLIKALDPARLKVKAKLPGPQELHYPDLKASLEKHLLPLIDEASSFACIFARMAHLCQKMVAKYLEEEEKFRFDDLLGMMLKGMTKKPFVDKVRARYKAAIIDEFQDTDPIQWEVFRNLFLGICPLYLVGDPKQSIYAFRQADIYTYLAAAESLGKENHASLDVNFRSQPSLVNALNVLFSATQEFLSLPRLNTSLEYPLVKSSDRIKEMQFSDSFGSLHFFIAEESEAAGSYPPKHFEEEYYFPFMLQEIKKLNRKNGFKFSQQAILVKDRFQAERLALFFKEYGIPAILQRTSSLYNSPALPAMRELLMAIISPKDESAMKVALGGQILRWDHIEIQDLDHQDHLEGILTQVYLMHQELMTSGFTAFFTKLLASCWKKDSLSVGERILQEEGGDEFYRDLNQLAELLSEHESLTKATAEGLLRYLNELEILHINEDERIKRRRNNGLDAVQILTLHTSKGLEFDIVFALGLVNRSPEQNLFLPIQEGLKRKLAPLIDTHSEAYLQYCKECDAEKMRQLYVAMTRAKYRLYVPVAFAPGDQPAKPGCSSPMELFLARLIGNEQNSHLLMDFLNGLKEKANLSYSYLKKESFVEEPPENETPPSLTSPAKVTVNNKPAYMVSFTQLAQGKASEGVKDKSPRDYEIANKSKHNLPAGAKTGILLHSIFESLPWKESDDLQELRAFVRSQIAGTDFEDWSEVITQMIFDVLHADLGPFRLIDLSEKRMYREIEFIYPGEGNVFLKGVIDMVCEYEGKYYLIDWKSNWLGGGTTEYNQENLLKAMEEHDYHLQVKLYKEALRRYFGIVDQREFDECFGGVIYVFIRGVDPDSPNSGILWV